MTGAWQLYAGVAVALICIGLHGVVVAAHLVRRLIAVNVLSVGVFMLLLAFGARAAPADPVPQAMVLTGIVVSVSVTALGAALAALLHRRTGAVDLSADEEERDA